PRPGRKDGPTMDSSRFDALTRMFARSASRRRAFGAAVAAALAPLTTAAGPNPAACLEPVMNFLEGLEGISPM
ncbi:MAG TPA: hypothetical protein VFI22_13345, partial [Thermomicrobiales bacterium]|nr:hypothetical protein [Thermomicrobiales bacterium]